MVALTRIAIAATAPRRFATAGKQIADLMFYSGRGAFTAPNDHGFLAARSTPQVDLASSAYRIGSLALTVDQRPAGRFLLLDCCYAASAYQAFQVAVLDVATR